MKKYLKDGKESVKETQQLARTGNGGQIRKVTEEMRQAMITAVANGLTPAEACMAMGVQKSWISNKCNDDEDFEIEILKALQSFKLYHINNIAKHASRSWQASAWLLERTFPDRFNSRVAQEMAARAKPKEPPKWFGETIEDAEVVDEPKTVEHGQSGDTEENKEPDQQAPAQDETAKDVL